MCRSVTIRLPPQSVKAERNTKLHVFLSGSACLSHPDILCTRNNCRDRLCCSARIYTSEDKRTSRAQNSSGDGRHDDANTNDDDKDGASDDSERKPQERKKRFPVKGQ